MYMFGVKRLGHDEDKSAVWEIIWMDSLLAKKNQVYLVKPRTIDLLELRKYL